MSSLPIAGSPTDAQPEKLTGLVQLFDPAMCCPTGLCGPGVDPSLLALARDLRWLQAAGVTVERFGLAQQPEAFTTNAVVTELMKRAGDAALPATLVNGKVLLFGTYPTRELLLSALGGKPAQTGSPATPCCEPGSGCC
jgi:hypothetical protein